MFRRDFFKAALAAVGGLLLGASAKASTPLRGKTLCGHGWEEIDRARYAAFRNGSVPGVSLGRCVELLKSGDVSVNDVRAALGRPPLED